MTSTAEAKKGEDSLGFVWQPECHQVTAQTKSDSAFSRRQSKPDGQEGQKR